MPKWGWGDTPEWQGPPQNTAYWPFQALVTWGYALSVNQNAIFNVYAGLMYPNKSKIVRKASRMPHKRTHAVLLGYCLLQQTLGYSRLVPIIPRRERRLFLRLPPVRTLASRAAHRLARPAGIPHMPATFAFARFYYQVGEGGRIHGLLLYVAAHAPQSHTLIMAPTPTLSVAVA